MSISQKELNVDSPELQTEVRPEIEIQPEEVVLNSGDIRGMATEVSDDARITDFTAPRSGINHGHGPDKHDVRSVFGVRDEFVEKYFADFGIAPNDHAALWLMSYRKDEFINADEPIFNRVADDCDSTWRRIENRKKKAPIAPETQRALRP